VPDSWIPLGYIFETDLIDMLINRVGACRVLDCKLNAEQFLEVPDFRNVTLRCLSEIGAFSLCLPQLQLKLHQAPCKLAQSTTLNSLRSSTWS
jgi:hypothetical protein